jgi:hypothetical protein
MISPLSFKNCSKDREVFPHRPLSIGTQGIPRLLIFLKWFFFAAVQELFKAEPVLD